MKKQRSKPGPKKKHPMYKKGWNHNPYGRYPTSSQVKKYLAKTEQYYAPSTQKGRVRKLRLIVRQIEELGAQNNVYKWTRDDILRWKADIDRRLDHATKSKYWRILRDLLDFYKITIIEDMLDGKEIRMPQVPPKEIVALDEKTIWQIYLSTLGIEGWEGDALRFLTLAYPYTGLRPSEMRTLKFEDIDLATWTFQVSAPKGADSYGRKRTVGIPQIIRKEWAWFMKMRKHYLNNNNLPEDFEWLIPCRARYEMSCWPEGKWNTIKRDLNKLSGIDFRWKDYRSTFCQMAIDKGASLQAVSKIMGHKTTSTTESYYGRIQDDDAINEINDAFK